MTGQATRLVSTDDRDDAIAELSGVIQEACESFGGTAGAHRLASGGGYDANPWRVLGVEIGIAAFGLPEAVGGFGGLPAILCTAQVLGRFLIPVPFLSTVLAGQILLRCGTAGHAGLRAIIAGEVVTVAALTPEGTWDAARTMFTVDDAGRLNGSAMAVLHALDADWIVVAAGDRLYLVDASIDECDISVVEALDPSRRFGSVSLKDAPGFELCTDVAAVLVPALDIAQLVLAAEQVGGAQACLDSTVAYVKERRQFGRAIGSFQSVKHTLADLLVLTEMSRSAIDRGTDVDESNETQLAEAASVAQVWCADAYRTVSAEALQLHGGIGFTWEHDAHLYFRRARSDAAMFGNSAHHGERLAKMLTESSV